MGEEGHSSAAGMKRTNIEGDEDRFVLDQIRAGGPAFRDELVRLFKAPRVFLSGPAVSAFGVFGNRRKILSYT